MYHKSQSTQRAQIIKLQKRASSLKDPIQDDYLPFVISRKYPQPIIAELSHTKPLATRGSQVADAWLQHIYDSHITKGVYTHSRRTLWRAYYFRETHPSRYICIPGTYISLGKKFSSTSSRSRDSMGRSFPGKTWSWQSAPAVWYALVTWKRKRYKSLKTCIF